MYGGDAQQEQGSSIIDELSSMLDVDAEDDADCWAENWLTLQIFAALGTQWSVTQGGYFGLRYEALPVVFDEFGIKHEDRAEMTSSLRIMEIEALQVINKR